MKWFKLLPYKRHSSSAKLLAQGLGIKRINLERTSLRHPENLIIFNWGNASNVPREIASAVMVNHPSRVDYAANKINSFNTFNTFEVPTVPNTQSYEEALQWIGEGREVFCRTLITGNSGQGIVIAETPEQLVRAPLYTQYRKKKNEYRIHVGRNPQTASYGIIDTQRKAKSNGIDLDSFDWRIRNHSNGFIFARNEDHVIPEQVIEASVKAVEKLGLDFGAVDVGWNEHYQEAYVYEVNTACGLAGTTLENYINYFNCWRNYYV